MARYIDYNYDQMKMIPVAFSQQIIPGSFEHSLSWLIDHELDLSLFGFHYKNDLNGRPAYDPALLLKIVIFAYSRGITSSRRIERLCRENIIFMALSADTRPHFTTLSDFISRSPEAISELFTQIVLMCDQQGLISRDATKEWSSTLEPIIHEGGVWHVDSSSVHAPHGYRFVLLRDHCALTTSAPPEDLHRG